MTTFAAIDFETASHDSGSACSVGVVIVSGSEIVQRIHRLIRPPDSRFVFTYIHGLTWRDVADAPPFCEVWADIVDELDGVEFLAAHNAGFDRGVLASCCRLYGLVPPPLEFVCTVTLARRQWQIRPTRLPDVCRHLGITLQHHQALSDAEACARIVLAASAEGWRPPARVPA